MWLDDVSRIRTHDIRQVIPAIVYLEAPVRAVGLEVRTNLRQVFRDVPALGKSFARARSEWPVPHMRIPWTFVAVSRGHDAESGAFTYFLGEIVTEIRPLPDGWLSLVIPVGANAIFPVRPRHKAGWPVALATARRHIYRRWLPASDYFAAGWIDDFKVHDECSLRRRGPEVDLCVAIRPKGEGSHPPATRHHTAGASAEGSRTLNAPFSLPVFRGRRRIASAVAGAR